MMSSQPISPLSLRSNARVWRLSAAVLLLATAVWLIGSWAATHNWLDLPYVIDVPATFLLALVLLALGLLAAWHSWQLEQAQAHDGHKQWLSVLLVKREEAEQAVDAIESLFDALELLQQAWRPGSEDQSPLIALTHASPLNLISPALQPVLSLQPEVTQQLQSLQARLVNLQVKFGRGDSLDTLAYDLQPLSQEYRHLESALNQLFSELQSLERHRIDQLDRLHQQQSAQDPYAEWRMQVESALAHVDRARQALARSLDQTPPARAPHLDDYLGLRP